MGVHWGGGGRCGAALAWRGRWPQWFAALTATLALVGTAQAQQQGFYGPYGLPPQPYPYYCPPQGPCPPPGYPPGMAPGVPPGMAPYAPGMAPYPPGMAPRQDRSQTRPQERPQTPPRDGEDRPTRPGDADRTEQPSDQQDPDLGSPTAEQDAAAQQAAADFSSASAATGTPSAPASATPNAIGDFFGNPGNVVVLSFPTGFIPLNMRVSGDLLALDGNGAVTGDAAQIQALVDPLQVPGQIFVGSGATFAALPQLVNGQVVIVPTSFVSTGNNFTTLPNTFGVQQEPGVAGAIQNVPGVQSVSFNGNGNFADVVPGTGNGPGGTNGTAALANVHVDYSYVVNQFVPGGEIIIVVPSPGYGGAIGQTKIGDNNSARPQDRVFLDFQYFEDVPQSVGGVDVRRLTLGFERTFDGPGGMLSSFEFRMPMASTLSSELIANAPTESSNEYGNVALTLKTLIYDAPMLDIALGGRLTVPTADDVSLSLTDGTPLIVQENDAYHFIPYLAALYESGGRIFLHAFANVDFDLNGNPVLLNPDGGGLRRFGRLTDQTALFLDGSFGYWLYRNPSRRFYGLAGMAELHYNKTLNEAEEAAAGNIRIGNRDADVDLVNATLGAHAIFGLTTFSNGFSFPITRSERVFDWEYRFFINRNF